VIQESYQTIELSLDLVLKIMADTDLSFRDRIIDLIRSCQERITASLEEIEGSNFLRDSWTRHDNRGSGQANVIQHGRVFSKGGVNFTQIEMTLMKELAMSATTRGKDIDMNNLNQYNLFATGVSLVIHPDNPMVPTVHANYRYIEITKGDTVIDWWFAGGADLTPYYLFVEDVVEFHQGLKDACDGLDKSLYPKWKKECDSYFLIKHRKFTRGVGGIFFDDLNCFSKEDLMNLVTRCVDAFISSYCSIVIRRKDLPYTDTERFWQEVRRGHYIEFNLVYDRGTMFGLRTPDSNIEAIFMPCPPVARWEYKYSPEEGSREHELLEALKNPRDWI
jgi:coproporphyrinogen III oxidase